VKTNGLKPNNEPTYCELAKQYLKERIATHNINGINLEQKEGKKEIK